MPARNKATTIRRQPRHSRSRFIVFLAMLTLLQCGCRWSGMPMEAFSPFKPKIQPVVAPNTSQVEIIDWINGNASHLRSWQSENTVIKVKGPASPMAISLSAVIAVEAPRNFRLRAQSTLAHADMGSNEEQLWFWVQPGADNVMTAHHVDVPMIQQYANLPFDPEWLMEVLGVIPLDRDNVVLHARPDNRSNFSTLVFHKTAADGREYKSMITVDNRFGVTEHRLLDHNEETLARATLSNHRTIDGITIPHRIKLEWPLTKTTFEMRLKDVSANCSIDSDHWEVPHMDNYPAMDLGKEVAARFGLQRPADGPAQLATPQYSGQQSLQDIRQQLHAPVRTVEQLAPPQWDDETF